MDKGKSVDVQGNLLLDSTNTPDNNNDITMNETSSPISHNSPHQGENRGEKCKQENTEVVSCAASNVLPQPEIAPPEADIEKTDMHSVSSSTVESSDTDLPDCEPDTAAMDDSTVTDLPSIPRRLRITERNNGIVIREPGFGQVDEENIGDEIRLMRDFEATHNIIGQHFNDNLPSHHSGSLMCPALSEAVQEPSNAASGAAQGNYGEMLRSMAGNNWSESAFSGFQPLPAPNPSIPARLNISYSETSPTAFFNAAQPPLFTSAAPSSGYDGAANQQSSIVQELIQYFRHSQNGFNNNNLLNNQVPIFQAPERLPMPGIGESNNNNNQMFQNVLNNNFVPDNNYLHPILHQNTLPQIPMMPSTALNLSNLSFTQLMSLCDTMTSAFSDYWIRQQLTDHHDYQAPILNNPVAPMVNNNAVYNPNGFIGNSVPLGSAQNFSSSLYQAQQAPAPLAARNSLLVPNRAPANAMARDSNPGQLQIALNNVTRQVPRRRRSSLNRPAIFLRPQIGAPIRRSVNSAASNNIGANSSNANILNSQTVIQAGEQNQINGEPRRDRINLGGRPVDVIPVKIRTIARRQEAAAESSASSSKRSKRQVLVRRESLAANSQAAAEQTENALANIGAALSEENSNDLDGYSIASSSQSDDPRVTNGVYDPEFERMGLPVDPFLRMFALSKWNKNRK